MARQDAAAAGVELRITSGWRSAREQQRLVDEAITRFGSAEAAHRWVLPPERSAHVAGLAIDVGPAAGARWLEERGSAYGLCRVYLNEPWHFEPLVAARHIHARSCSRTPARRRTEARTAPAPPRRAGRANTEPVSSRERAKPGASTRRAFPMEPPVGFEPTTVRLQGGCSTS